MFAEMIIQLTGMVEEYSPLAKAYEGIFYIKIIVISRTFCCMFQYYTGDFSKENLSFA